MFKNVDRILVAVQDLDQAEQNYRNILGATPIEDFESRYLNAKVRRIALGASEVELCQPLGPGPIATRLQEKGEGLVCGGVTTDDLTSFAKHLDERGVPYVAADDRIYPESTSLYGLPLAVSASPQPPRPRANGPVEYLYELTMVLKTSWGTVAQHYADAFGLDRENEVGIVFARFGYEGALLKFDADRLDRIELSEAHDTAYPMGRYTARHGDALYMCYVETDDLADIIARLDKHGCRWTRRTTTPVERDGLWIHPSALNGILLGVSRSSLAWGWSGKPEWVQPLRADETA
ncbi:VOC family protein [Verticiella sediminum]|nr:VOC family protein [Verticiella sediminum]